jgi:hypothetical protein
MASNPKKIEIADSNKINSFMDYAMGVVCLVAAGAIYYYAQPLTFQIEHPDFNPVVFLIPGALLYSIFCFYNAIKRTIHQRKYGLSVLVLETEPQIGTTITGVIRTSLNVTPDNTVFYHLICVDNYLERSQRYQRDHVRWEAKEQLNGIRSEAAGGIPVNLMVPTDALSTQNDPRARGEVRWILKVDVKGTPYGAIFILGMRAAISKKKK